MNVRYYEKEDIEKFLHKKSFNINDIVYILDDKVLRTAVIDDYNPFDSRYKVSFLNPIYINTINSVNVEDMTFPTEYKKLPSDYYCGAKLFNWESKLKFEEELKNVMINDLSAVKKALENGYIKRHSYLDDVYYDSYLEGKNWRIEKHLNSKKDYAWAYDKELFSTFNEAVKAELNNKYSKWGGEDLSKMTDTDFAAEELCDALMNSEKYFSDRTEEYYEWSIRVERFIQQLKNFEDSDYIPSFLGIKQRY